MSDKRIVVLLNLVIGFYNLYLYSVGGSWFNLVVGTLNIGVWVFFRRVYDDSE